MASGTMLGQGSLARGQGGAAWAEDPARTSPAMGNNGSHERTKVPKQVGKKRPPDMDKAPGRQPFFSCFRQKSGVSGGWEGQGTRPGGRAGMLGVQALCSEVPGPWIRRLENPSWGGGSQKRTGYGWGPKCPAETDGTWESEG